MYSKIIVMLGTFALALAFAGNDLVNFIGVPLVGYSSYMDLMARGNDDDGYIPDGFAACSGSRHPGISWSVRGW